MQKRNFRNQIKQKLEEAQLNMTLRLEDFGMHDTDIDGTLTQILDEEFDMADFRSKLVAYLSGLSEVISHADEIKTLSQIQEIYTQQKTRLQGLQKQEEEFNKNVQVVVESDEQQMKLN